LSSSEGQDLKRYIKPYYEKDGSHTICHPEKLHLLLNQFPYRFHFKKSEENWNGYIFAEQSPPYKGLKKHPFQKKNLQRILI